MKRERANPRTTGASHSHWVWVKQLSVGTDSCRWKLSGHGSYSARRLLNTTAPSLISRQARGIILQDVKKCSTCEFLLRLNGYSRSIWLQYEKAGADAEEHVEQFLLNCGDDNLMGFIYPLRLDNLQKVKKIISHWLLGEKRNKQRDGVSNLRSPEPRQCRFRDNRQTDAFYDDKTSLDARYNKKSDAWKHDQRQRQEDRIIGLSDGHQGRNEWSVHSNTRKG